MRRIRETARGPVTVTKAAAVDPNWASIPHHQMTPASRIAGVSEGSLYRAAEEGRLKLVRLAGRTLVDTESLKAFIASAQPWTPSDRGAAARAKRSEAARAALR